MGFVFMFVTLPRVARLVNIELVERLGLWQSASMEDGMSEHVQVWWGKYDIAWRCLHCHEMGSDLLAESAVRRIPYFLKVHGPCKPVAFGIPAEEYLAAPRLTKREAAKQSVEWTPFNTGSENFTEEK